MKMKLNGMIVPQKWDLAQAVVHHLSEHFGEPIGDRREGSYDSNRKEGVVKVSQHKIGIVKVDVGRPRHPRRSRSRLRSGTPATNARAHSMGVFRVIEPPYRVAI